MAVPISENFCSAAEVSGGFSVGLADALAGAFPAALDDLSGTSSLSGAGSGGLGAELSSLSSSSTGALRWKAGQRLGRALLGDLGRGFRGRGLLVLLLLLGRSRPRPCACERRVLLGGGFRRRHFTFETTFPVYNLKPLSIGLMHVPLLLGACP